MTRLSSSNRNEDLNVTQRMKPYYHNGGAAFYQGDARDVLRALQAASVDACVTSPPYWSLRDYGISPSIWGGRRDCRHRWRGIERHAERYTGKRKWQHIGEEARAAGMKVRDVDGNAWGHPKKTDSAACRCGASQGVLGLERTPSLYVKHVVEVFREVRRVLRDDGTLWLNLGDSYAADAAAAGETFADSHGLGVDRVPPVPPGPPTSIGEPGAPTGLKRKDLAGIPWLVAFALRADGWYLRSDIIWVKTNAMPESVRDRPTRAHEYLFLLSKREHYWYDREAIREPQSGSAHARGRGVTPKSAPAGNGRIRANESFHAATARFTQVPGGRNRRTVWTLPTAPYREAHFATFPPDLVRPCILAGCRQGGTVIDPFAGSCTTAFVAKQLGRRSIMVDPNAAYLDMGIRRIIGT